MVRLKHPEKLRLKDGESGVLSDDAVVFQAFRLCFLTGLGFQV